MRDVHGSDRHTVFAVGSDGLILRFEGRTWEPMSSGTRADLRAVWCQSAHQAFAVGADGTLLELAGDQWRQIDSGTGEDLLDVWGIPTGTLVAVGSMGTIVCRSGGRWRVDWDEDRVDLEPWVDFVDGHMRLQKTDPDGDFSSDYEDLDFTRTGDC